MPSVTYNLLLVIAAPALILMAVWTAVNVARLLFPERGLPLSGPARRAAARRRGQSIPVRAFDIVEDLRRRPVRPAMPQREAVAEGERPGPAALRSSRTSGSGGTEVGFRFERWG
jgi:hypothetical protein